MNLKVNFTCQANFYIPFRGLTLKPNPIVCRREAAPHLAYDIEKNLEKREVF